MIRERGALGSAFFLLGLGFACLGPQKKAVAPDSLDRTLSICVLDAGEGHSHGERVLQSIRSLVDTSKVKLKLLPIYEKNGNLRSSVFVQKLKEAERDCELIHLSWNLPRGLQTIEIEKALVDVVQTRIVVAAAGQPETAETAHLSTTVMGSVFGTLLVAESNDDGALVHPAYIGEGLALQIPSIKGESGSSFASPRLTAALANSWASRTAVEWFQWREQVLLRVKAEGPFRDLQSIISLKSR